MLVEISSSGDRSNLANRPIGHLGQELFVKKLSFRALLPIMEFVRRITCGYNAVGKGSATNSAKHPIGRTGYGCRTPFPLLTFL